MMIMKHYDNNFIVLELLLVYCSFTVTCISITIDNFLSNLSYAVLRYIGNFTDSSNQI